MTEQVLNADIQSSGNEGLSKRRNIIEDTHEPLKSSEPVKATKKNRAKPSK